MARVIDATSQNVKIRATRKEIRSFRESGHSAKLIQEEHGIILLTQGQFVQAFGQTGRVGQEFDLYSGQFVQEPSAPPSDIPREYWGTSSERYGEVSETGQIVKTHEQISREAGLIPTKPSQRETEAAERKAETRERLIGAGFAPHEPTERSKQLKISREIYERATPQEKLGLRASTLFSGRGWEFMASGFTPETTPKEVTISHMFEISKKPEQQVVFESAVFNPFTQVGFAYLGGAALGVASTTAVGGRVLGSTAGKIVGGGLTASYLGAETYTGYQYYQKGEYAKALGTGIQATYTLAPMGLGIKAGQQIGTLRQIRIGAGELQKAGTITPTEAEIITTGTRMRPARRGKVLREPEETEVLGLTKRERVKIFKEVKIREGEVIGSVGQEAQMEKPRVARDIDILLYKPDGKARLKELGVKDIKIGETAKRIRRFPFRERPITTPRGQKLTSYREQYYRKLAGSVERAHYKKQDIYDVQRYLKAEKPKGLPERVERYRPPRERVRVKEPHIEDYSYLPQRAKITPSYLPSKPTTRPSLIPSKIPSRPSGISPLGRPSIFPHPSAPPYVPSRMPPSRPPSRLPPYRPSAPPYVPSEPPYTPPHVPSRQTYMIEPPPTRPPGFDFDFESAKLKKPKKRDILIRPHRGYAPSLIGAMSRKVIGKAPSGLLTGVGVRYRVKRKKR